MKGIFTCASVILTLLMMPQCLMGGVSSQDVAERMNRDFSFIENTFQAKYAPARWKQTSLGWDLAKEIQIAQQRILRASPLTLGVYRHALKKFLRSMQDYHVSASFYSTKKAVLPFSVGGVQGRYFITSITPDGINDAVFKLSVGDELLTFNGKPVAQMVTKLRNRNGKHSNLEADELIAQTLLTRRALASGIAAPQGSVAITVRQKATGAELDLNFTWQFTKEQFHTPALTALAPQAPGIETAEEQRLFEHNHRPYLYDHIKKPSPEEVEGFAFDYDLQGGGLANTNDPDQDINDIGNRTSFLPALGKVLWESPATSIFRAYLFQTDSGKTIGYVRIPTYDATFPVDTVANVQEFTNLMSFFQNASSALVIDQLNNPGGAFFYFYALASHLTNTPLTTPKHHLSLTHADFAQASQKVDQLSKVTTDAEAIAALGQNITGFPVDLTLAKQMLAYNTFITQQWTAGKIFTDAYPLFGMDQLRPATFGRYTKPIVILINGLDFSCGDFFPALFQDNKRALLFGTRTAGAGGFIAQMKYSTPFGTTGIQYTASIAQRLNGKPIENLGVTPDVEYQLTVDDMQNNYRGYVRALLAALEKYMQGQ